MFSRECERITAKFSFFFFALSPAILYTLYTYTLQQLYKLKFTENVPGQFVSIFQVKQISKLAKEIHKREVIFSVAVVAAKTPSCT